jgi:hypothetical protein
MISAAMYSFQDKCHLYHDRLDIYRTFHDNEVE